MSADAKAIASVAALGVVLAVMAAFLLLRRALGGGGVWCAHSPRLDGRVALVTGSSSGGIGHSVACALARLGATVVLANRSPDRNAAAAAAIAARVPGADVEQLALDLSDARSVDACAAAFLRRHARVDLLVCNAAAMGAPRPLSAQGFEWHFAVNALGHFRLVRLLLPALARDGSRVVFTASMGHRVVRALDYAALQAPTPGDPNRSFACYGASKLAVVLYASELQRRLRHAETLVLCADPGVARTHITEQSLPRWVHALWSVLPIAATPEEAAQTILHCCLAPSAALVPGGYYYGCKATAPSKAAMDAAAAAQLWQWVSEHDSET